MHWKRINTTRYAIARKCVAPLQQAFSEDGCLMWRCRLRSYGDLWIMKAKWAMSTEETFDSLPFRWIRYLREWEKRAEHCREHTYVYVTFQSDECVVLLLCSTCRNAHIRTRIYTHTHSNINVHSVRTYGFWRECKLVSAVEKKTLGKRASRENGPLREATRFLLR